MFKSSDIKRAASQAGFDLCGVSRVRNLPAEREFFDRWLYRGCDSGLEYLRRNIEKRFSPEVLMPGARSVISCAVSYKNDTSLGFGESSRVPKIASYARAPVYQETIKDMLRATAHRLTEIYGDFKWRAFSDTAPVLEKKWAEESGLGFIGRNTLLVSPTLGSFVLLGELIVDARVDEYDQPYSGPGCGECRRCVERCPNRALTPDGLDTARCISRLTIEKRGGDAAGDVSYKSEEVSLHGWLFGCDECQSVCPYNLQAPVFRNPRFAPIFDPRDMDGEKWGSMREEEFAARFGRTPLSRAGLERLKCNLE